MEAVFESGSSASCRLEKLGLDEKTLLKAARRGLQRRLSCTPNHPPLYHGSTQWAETVAALRELHIPREWRKVDEDGLSLIVNREGTIGISVCTGDENTGITSETPMSKSSKGPKTSQLVRSNVRQLRLAPFREEPAAFTTQPRRQTWIFLVRKDDVSQELRCELSLPINMSEDGRVDGWQERIILPSTPFDDSLSIGDEDLPSEPSTDFEVTKRA